MSALAPSVKVNGFIHIYGTWGIGSQEAEGTLTMDVQPTDGDTFTVDGRTYTFQTTLTDVNGNIAIGGSLAQAKLNLVAAFDLSGTPGTDFALSMVAHETVDIAAFIADDAILTAKVGGTIGNSIVTTETFTAGTNIFDAATLGTTTAGVDTAVFERGNDFSGDGTAKAPYANTQEAMNQLKIHVVNDLAKELDKNYFMLHISKLGETNDYVSNLNFQQVGNAVDGTPIPTGIYQGSTTRKVIWQGWRKDDGLKLTDAQVGQWTEVYDTEKPKLTSLQNTISLLTTINGYRGQSFQIKDCVLDMLGEASFANSLFNVSQNAANASVASAVQIIGCIIRGGIRNLGIFNVSNGQFRFIGIIASIVEMSEVTGATGNNDTRKFFQNCTFPNLVNGINYDRIAFLRVQGASNIYRSTGILSRAPNDGGSFKGNFNVYNRVGAIAEDPSGAALNTTLQDVIDSQTPSGDGVFQQHSFDLDPLFVDFSGNDFTLKAGSIAEAVGGKAPGLSEAPSVVDPDSKGWDKFDFLNKLWIDTTEETLNLFTTTVTIRTRRSIGAFQSLVSGSPQNPQILFPLTTTEGQPQHIVFQANKSPQAGTVHAQVVVADNSDLTLNAQFFDSVPINITTSNNKINFKEDGGGELTATLTVGIFTTASLLTEIKTQLEAAGTGTYTVTYDGLSGTNTRLFTIAVSGAITNVQFLWHSGTDVLNNARQVLGFNQFDTINTASHDSDSEVRENFYDATITWEDADDYTAGENPLSSGTWLDIGTGDPSGSGTPNTDGADGDGTHDIRVDIPAKFGLNSKFIGASLWSGARVGQL